MFNSATMPDKSIQVPFAVNEDLAEDLKPVDRLDQPCPSPA